MDSTPKVRWGARSIAGQVRDLNEDSLGCPPERLTQQTIKDKGLLYAVADGMGGHAAGEVASRQALDILFREYYGDPSTDVGASLRDAFDRANAGIHQQASAHTGRARMGTTLVAAVVRGDEWLVANVGDSRAYLIRSGVVQQITQDHSWVAEQVRQGLMTSEEAHAHPYAHIITRALGQSPEVKTDLFRRELHPEDTILLCSDGLSNELQDSIIGDVVAHSEPQGGADKLVELADERGGHDNITALLIRMSIPRRTPFTAIPAGILSALRDFWGWIGGFI